MSEGRVCLCVLPLWGTGGGWVEYKLNSYICSMKKELGKWLMDIAKYMTTAVLLSSLFSDMDNWPWYVYLLIVLAVLITLDIGLLMFKEKKED